MFLQCPSCQSQYRIQANAVNTEGRKVKCKKCAHIWTAQAKDIREEVVVPQQIAVGDYQTAAQSQPPEPPKPPETHAPAEVIQIKPEAAQPEPTPEPTPEPEPPVEEAVVEPASEPEAESETPAEPTAAEPIEEEKAESREYPRMKPAIDPDGEAQPRFAAKHIEKKKGSSLVAFSVTILVIGFFMVGIIMGRTGIVKHWPATALAYDMVGLHVPVIGEGLRFENIKTSYDKDVEGESIILLQGEIKNVAAETKSIPLVAIFPFDKKNKALANTKVKIKGGDFLEPGKSVSFSAQVPASTTLDPQDKFIFIEE